MELTILKSEATLRVELTILKGEATLRVELTNLNETKRRGRRPERRWAHPRPAPRSPPCPQSTLIDDDQYEGEP